SDYDDGTQAIMQITLLWSLPGGKTWPGPGAAGATHTHMETSEKRTRLPGSTRSASGAQTCRATYQLLSDRPPHPPNPLPSPPGGKGAPRPPSSVGVGPGRWATTRHRRVLGANRDV